uniref:Sugar O-methyltransferase n=1 Tax=Haptolina brevifila TaxID=156173 RepID=A0A7S2HQZ4_9EUKA
MAPGNLTKWAAPTSGQAALLQHAENYDVLLPNFCQEVALKDIPNTAGYVEPPKLFVPKAFDRNGCNLQDPGYARKGHVMMAAGLNCPTPFRCLPADWLTQLEQVFAKNAKHLTKNDLFVANGSNVPYVEARNAEVLYYPFYRFGLHVDFLLSKGNLIQGGGTMLEIGAGWAGVAAIVKRKSPLTRYIIVDIPTSIAVQMSFLHSVGFTNLVGLDDAATDVDVKQLLCCTAFDVLFLKPQQVPRLPPKSVDVTANFDSLVEMPDPVMQFYLNELPRITKKALYTVNTVLHSPRRFRMFESALRKMGAEEFTMQADNFVVHPQRKAALSTALGISEGYKQYYLRRQHGHKGGQQPHPAPSPPP